MYFKTKENNLFFEPSEAVIKKYELEKITKNEFDATLIEQQKPSEEDLKNQRIAELKQNLSESDFKVLPDYKKRAGLTEIQMQKILDDRDAWYKELKELEG